MDRLPDGQAPAASLRKAFADYRNRWPEEGATVDRFERLLAEGTHGFMRERLAGHFTASAWLVSGDCRRVLLTHHRKLGRWLQLGGHADGDTDLARAALREAREESGLCDLLLDTRIFDLDQHRIPAHGGVPAHWHYDVRYLVRAMGLERFVVSGESHALAWREVAELPAEPGLDASVRRMAVKWLAASQGLPGCG